jgi:4-phosphoerythronate dehydrogenase (FAD-dependent)
MSNVTEFQSKFSDIIGDKYVTLKEDISERYLVDVHQKTHGTAMLLLRPASTEEVSQCVKICYDHGLTVTPFGGNTGYCSGAIPLDEKTVLISLERLNAIRDIDPTNLTLTVESGAILQNIQDAADEKDLYFPLHLGAYGSCQIGGNLSTNAGGVNVLKYGMARQFCLGLEVVMPDGSVFNDMNLLRKNNSGYDLKQLFIGAEGTLGIITAATFMLYPKSQQKTTAFVVFAKC